MTDDGEAKPERALVVHPVTSEFLTLGPDDVDEASSMTRISQELIAQAMQKVGEEERLISPLKNAQVLVGRLQKYCKEPLSNMALPTPLTENAGIWIRVKRRFRDAQDARQVRRRKRVIAETVSELEKETTEIARLLKSLRRAEEPAFRCKQEFDDCMSNTPQLAVICVLSYLACTLRQFLKVSVTIDKGGSG